MMMAMTYSHKSFVLDNSTSAGTFVRVLVSYLHDVIVKYRNTGVVEPALASLGLDGDDLMSMFVKSETGNI